MRWTYDPGEDPEAAAAEALQEMAEQQRQMADALEDRVKQESLKHDLELYTEESGRRRQA